MKAKFFEYYYHPTKEEFKNLMQQGWIVLDTNILIGIYRLTSANAGALLNLLKAKSHQIWIPYQVGKEFHKNIHNIINNGGIKKCDDKLDAVNNINKAIKTLGDLLSPQEKKQLDIIVSKLMPQIDSLRKDKIEEIYNNPLMSSIANLLKDKVGDAFTQIELKRIYKEGEKRYGNNIPPGYKDKSKGGIEQYGDLVIWKEIIQKSRQTKKPVIFITNDKKDDWFLKHDNKKIGPNLSLVREFHEETGLTPPSFYIYTWKQFLRMLERTGDSDVSDELFRNVDNLQLMQEEENNNSDLENMGSVDGPNNNSETTSNSSGQTGNNNSAP